MAILLHSCCGPCLGAAIHGWRDADPDFPLVTFWENPNIQPFQEYFQRLTSFKKMATDLGLEIITGDIAYGLRRFHIEIGDSSTRPGRCEIWFRMRLDATAAHARRRSFEAFSTTLLVSPYQDREMILRVGRQVGQDHGLPFVGKDLRPHFRKSYAEARRLDLYRQKYCGCIFSEEERFEGDQRFQLPLP